MTTANPERRRAANLVENIQRARRNACRQMQLVYPIGMRVTWWHLGRQHLPKTGTVIGYAFDTSPTHIRVRNEETGGKLTINARCPRRDLRKISERTEKVA